MEDDLPAFTTAPATKGSHPMCLRTYTTQAKGGSGKPNGFQKPVQLSEALAEFVGESTMSRPELTKKFWE